MGVIRCCAQAHFSSSQVFGGWKRRKFPGVSVEERKLWRREMRTVRPLTLKVGDLYQIQNKTVMDVTSTLLVGTVRLSVLINRE